MTTKGTCALPSCQKRRKCVPEDAGTILRSGLATAVDVAHCETHMAWDQWIGSMSADTDQPTSERTCVLTHHTDDVSDIVEFALAVTSFAFSVVRRLP